MIWFTLTLRLHGDLVYIRGVTQKYAGIPWVQQRDDGRNGGTIVLRLAQGMWGSRDVDVERATARLHRQQWRAAARLLHEVMPLLLTYDRDRCNAELTLNMGRDNAANFVWTVPREFINAAGKADMPLKVAFYLTEPDQDFDKYD